MSILDSKSCSDFTKRRYVQRYMGELVPGYSALSMDSWFDAHWFSSHAHGMRMGNMDFIHSTYQK